MLTFFTLWNCVWFDSFNSYTSRSEIRTSCLVQTTNQGLTSAKTHLGFMFFPWNNDFGLVARWRVKKVPDECLQNEKETSDCTRIVEILGLLGITIEAGTSRHTYSSFRTCCTQAGQTDFLTQIKNLKNQSGRLSCYINMSWMTSMTSRTCLNDISLHFLFANLIPEYWECNAMLLT